MQVIDFDNTSIEHTFSLLMKIQEKCGNLEEQRDSFEQRISSLKEDLLVLEKVQEFFREMNDQATKASIERMLVVVSTGLKEIFFDRDIKFGGEFIVKNGKPKLDLFFVIDGARRSAEDVGGGVVAVTSCILRVVQLKLFKKAPYLFLDEALGPLSSRYRPRAIQFFEKLSSKFGVKQLVITHPTNMGELLKTIIEAKNTNGYVIYTKREV